MSDVLCEVICEGGLQRFNRGEVVTLPEHKVEEYLHWTKGGRPSPLVRVLSASEAKAYGKPPAHKMITSAAVKVSEE